MNETDDEFDPAEAMSEVIDAAQMYLAECDPDNLAIIPERCMPYPIISAEDVELYAHKLRKECVARKAAGAQIPGELEAMREFFARAARVIYLLRVKLEDADLDATIPLPYARTSSDRPSHRL
jgi:hypothetical protein